MHPAINKKITAILILSCCFGVSVKAQVASSKVLTSFYNDITNEKLAESNVSKSKFKSQRQKQNLPSNDPVINEMANSKIKNPSIALHTNSQAFAPEIKSKLPSFTDLQQKGHPLIKPK